MKTKKRFAALLAIVLFRASTLSAFANSFQLENETANKPTIGTETLLTFLILILFLSCGYLFYKMNRLKKTRTLVGDEAINEINYAYTNLKKAWTNLKEENIALNNKITFLTNNITDLESANYELLKQKEKLVHNENRLLELQKQKEELFSMAIHDIKNPAAAIKSYVELLEGYDLNAVEQQEIVKYLVDSTEQILQLAQSINRSVMGEESDTIEEEDKESGAAEIPF